MRRFAKVLWCVLGTLGLLVALGLGLGANYLVSFALDSQFGKGALSGGAASTEGALAAGLPVSITSHDGLGLHAQLLPAESPTHRFALLVHGYKAAPASMAEYARHYHKAGWNVLVPHHRGHGDSQGRYIGMGWLEHYDLLGWIGFVVKENPAAEIVLHGVSMGAATVMLATGSGRLPGNVVAAVADCGYSTVTEEFKHQLKQMFGLPSFPLLPLASMVAKLRAGYSFGQVDCVAAVGRSSTPTLFIHGDQDTFVPFWMLEEVYNAAACPKARLVVPGAAHAKAQESDPGLYWSTVEAFTSSVLE